MQYSPKREEGYLGEVLSSISSPLKRERMKVRVKEIRKEVL
jgi:hypothetical protein